jgi:DNA-binding GntR family transcriptional regulator
MNDPLHHQLRNVLAARINARELAAGDLLPAERRLAEQFGVARSVVRQALAGLARDGLAVSVYPRGYRVLGPRIAWLPRLRPLGEEPWTVEPIDGAQVAADERDAAALGVAVGVPVVVRPFTLRGAYSDEPWAFALATYPLTALDADAHPLVLGLDFVTDDQLARASGRRIVGYHERIRARPAAASEHDTLALAVGAVVLDVHRTAHTTTTPFSTLSVAAVAHRFEVDYRIDV